MKKFLVLPLILFLVNCAFAQPVLRTLYTTNTTPVVTLTVSNTAATSAQNTLVSLIGYSNGNTNGGSANFFFGGGGNTTNSGAFENVAIGLDALNVVDTAGFNVAIGVQALLSDVSGNYNDAIGQQAQMLNVTGTYNEAMGLDALKNNTNGTQNVAIGSSALFSTSGSWNTAVGVSSLGASTIGNYNIAVGNNAGVSITTGGTNIDIGNQGISTDTNIIRIGTSQMATYLAGSVSDGNGTVWSSNSVWSLSAFTNGVQNFSIKTGISNAADGMHLIALSISNGVTVMLQHLP